MRIGPSAGRDPSVGEQAGAYAVGQAITFPLNLLFDLLIARTLGPVMRGQWFLMLAAVTFLANMLSLSIPAYAVYRLAKEPSQAGVLNGAVLRYAGIVAAVGLAAALLLSRVGPSAQSLAWVTPPLYGIAAVLVATELYIICSAGLLTGLGRIHLLSRVNVATASITLVVGAGPLVLFDLSAVGALATYLVARAMAAVIMTRAVATSAQGAGQQSSAALIRDMVRFGAAGQLGNLAVLTYQRVNLFLIAAFAGPQAVGYYSVAESLSTRLTVLVGPLQAAFVSRISGARQPEAARWTAQLVRIAGLLLVCVGAPLVLLAEPLLRSLYGADFTGGVAAFRLLLPASALTTAATLVSVFFSGHVGRPIINSIVSIITMVISIPLSYVLVRNLGMIGGAWSALMSGAVIFALVYGVFVTRNRLAIRSGLAPESADWDVLRDIARSVWRRER